MHSSAGCSLYNMSIWNSSLTSKLCEKNRVHFSYKKDKSVTPEKEWVKMAKKCETLREGTNHHTACLQITK